MAPRYPVGTRGGAIRPPRCQQARAPEAAALAAFITSASPGQTLSAIALWARLAAARPVTGSMARSSSITPATEASLIRLPSLTMASSGVSELPAHPRRCSLTIGLAEPPGTLRLRQVARRARPGLILTLQALP